MATITSRLAGVTFQNEYPYRLHYLRKAVGDFPLEASLIRDPENEYDANAIAVLCGGSFIGFIPASLAEKLAPKLDAGEKWRVIEAEILIHPEHEDRPGVEIKLERVNESD